MKLITIFISFFIFSNFLYAQEDIKSIEDIPTQKVEKIYTLLELTNIKKEADETISMLVDYFQRLAPHLPDEYRNEITDKFSGKEYLKKLVPIYDKYFSTEEIEKLISFYNSDVGRKFVNYLPDISIDSYKVKQEWEGEMAIELRKKLEEDGYIKKAKPLNNSGGDNE